MSNIDMDQIDGVAKSIEDKSMLVTGSTGFIAKIFVEKVLRIQPKVKKLFLLVRAKNDVCAKQRVEAEVMEIELFNVLREKHGKNFSSFFWDKVHPVAGDISSENLGINDGKLREFLWDEIDVIVNSAATTSFIDRYDTALSINTFGVKNVLVFAMKCIDLKMLLHISTAYVNTERKGVILEEPLSLDKAFNGCSKLDIEAEMALAQQTLEELTRNEASQDAIKIAMKELGQKRALLFGWSNTYRFTKAMGEFLAYPFASRLPLVILRPTMITSTYKEPFPGWIEGVRTIDMYITNFAMGYVKYFPADYTSILDLVPGDTVVNAMMAILAAHSHESSSFIYQIGSSLQNPLTIGEFISMAYRYCVQNPFTKRDGSLIKVKQVQLTTMAVFQICMSLLLKVPLQALRLLGVLHPQMRSKYNQLNRAYAYVLRVAKAYEPFTFYHGRFDNHNMQKLMLSMKEKDRELIPTDTKCIKWDEYIINIHIPGLFMYGIKERK
ncbi:probable fatty acyl-CoA reductase 4 [Typha angustifolia]|uniref:probable fatty acyl-CoA reductase 4 n=1 Tax=Typha angustifolia TaxID=59011 RepID=UPI003C2C8149